MMHGSNRLRDPGDCFLFYWREKLGLKGVLQMTAIFALIASFKSRLRNWPIYFHVMQ